MSLLHKQEDAHEDALWCVAWRPGGKSFITGSVDETVKVWSLGESDDTLLDSSHTYTGHTLGVISVAVDASGTFAASSALDSFIRVWNLEVGLLSSECSLALCFAACLPHIVNAEVVPCCTRTTPRSP